MQTKKSDNSTPVAVNRRLHELRAKAHKVLVSPQAQVTSKPVQQEAHGRVPLLPLPSNAKGHLKARPQLASASGQYPAIDRILARKQRLARLQDTCSQKPAGKNARQQISKQSTPLPAVASCSHLSRISSLHSSTAAQQRQPDSVQATCRSKVYVGSGEQTAHADVSSNLQPTSVRVLVSASKAPHSYRAGFNCGDDTAVPVSDCQQQPALPDAADTQHAHVRQGGTDVGSLVGSEHTTSYASYASDAAHKQYTYFKFSRQQRHAAAVIIQQHVRGVLARHLMKQLQKLRLHAEWRQQHVLALAMVSWREHAAMRCSLRARVRERSLRYGLWQHCHLDVHFDTDAVFRQEGKAVMAAQYRAWRTKAVVITRWQKLSTNHQQDED